MRRTRAKSVAPEATRFMEIRLAKYNTPSNPKRLQDQKQGAGPEFFDGSIALTLR
jgi:hypothetical protein